MGDDFATNFSLRTIFKKIQQFQFYLHILKINEFWQRKISSNWAQIWHIGISLCAKQSTKREIRNSKKSHFSPTLLWNRGWERIDRRGSDGNQMEEKNKKY